MTDPTWTEAFSSFTPSATGWQNYDLYTNKSVPKGAIAHIVGVNTNTGIARTIGVRADGSSLNRYLKLHEAENTGSVCMSMYVKCDSSTGYIEIYCDNTSDVIFYLTGYWSNTDYTEKFDTLTTSTALAWTDNNLYTNHSVPYNSVCDMIIANYTDGASRTMGVRTNDSGLTRLLVLHEAESSSSETTDCTCAQMIVKSDASGIIEYQTSSTTTSTIYLIGYFDSTMDYTEKFDTLSHGSTGYLDVDMTSYLDQDGRVCDIYCANNAVTWYYNVGARINGSSIDPRYILVHESEANGQNGYMIPTGTDESGVLELYSNNASYGYYRHMGYYKPGSSPAVEQSQSASSNAYFGGVAMF